MVEMQQPTVRPINEAGIDIDVMPPPPFPMHPMPISHPVPPIHPTLG